jgi:hypothetical protein
VLWVTEPRGEPNLNYCANPVTGFARVTLPPFEGDSTLVASDRSSIFFTVVAVNAHSVALDRAPISPACR